MIKSEQTINIESEIDNKKTDEQMHQIIESIETENSVDGLLQVQQQQEPHHQTVEVVTIETIIQVQQSAQPQAPRQQKPRTPAPGRADARARRSAGGGLSSALRRAGGRGAMLLGGRPSPRAARAARIRGGVFTRALEADSLGGRLSPLRAFEASFPAGGRSGGLASGLTARTRKSRLRSSSSRRCCKP